MSSKKKAPGREVSIRCYCHGFGDCFLLTFDPDSPTPIYVVIDCGLLLNTSKEKERMQEVVGDLFATTDGHIHALVVTHEHYDHLCGFTHAADKWANFQIEQVWLAWTENPQDPDAKKITKEKDDLHHNLRLAVTAMSPFSPGRERVQGLLGFSESTRQARDFVVSLAARKGAKPKYWKPGMKTKLPRDVAEVLFLGPPTDKSKLRRTETDTKQIALNLRAALGPQFDSDAGPSSYADYIRQALGLNRSSRQSVFDQMYEDDVRDSRFESQFNEWRRIGYTSDDRTVETFAMQLDSLTNNTSLAIAFRLKSTKVLLFPGDAQGGNWVSWTEQESAFGPIEALMASTAFYKVGHHGSHNGTFLKERFDVIPTDAAIFMPYEKVNRWPSIPHKPLIERFSKHKLFVTSEGASLAPSGFAKGGLSQVTNRPLWLEWSC